MRLDYANSREITLLSCCFKKAITKLITVHTKLNLGETTHKISLLITNIVYNTTITITSLFQFEVITSKFDFQAFKQVFMHICTKPLIEAL